MIEIVTAGSLNTVQDLGRDGLGRLGVGRSGVMDPVALRVGNLLLGNQEGAGGIEVQVFPFALRFLEPGSVAVTGADCEATLDGRPLPPWWAERAAAGSVLRLAPPSQGARACIAVGGGVGVAEVLGSRSTHLRAGFGGLDGRPLRDGDRLPTGPAPDTALPLGVAGPERGRAAEAVLRVLPAADYAAFPPAAQQAFWAAEWRISPQSNRHGYRLQGPALPGAPGGLRSAPLLPGLIQVPPSGQPIVQMSDANSAGGYARFGAVIGADLPGLGQARLGTRIRFCPVTFDEAVAAEAEAEAELDAIRRVLGLWRQRTERLGGNRTG